MKRAAKLRVLAENSKLNTGLTVCQPADNGIFFDLGPKPNIP